MVHTTAVACAMAVVHCTRFAQCGIFDLIIIRSNHTMRKVLLSLFCLALSQLSAAQPEAGKVYNLKNVNKDSSLGITNLLKVIGVTTNEDDLSQQWYVESVSGAAFSLRNMCSGLYLQGHNAASNAWTLVPAKVDLEYTSVSDAFAIRQSGHSNGYAYLHIDGSGNAVSWSYSNDSNTLWQFNEVKYTEEELNKALSLVGSMNVTEETVNKYQSALDALFADKACSQLKVMCTESEMKANADYLALPATLQQMVLKVLKGSWEESNGDPSKSKWDSDYARKYRVQLYEPYNEPEAGAKALRINAHTNLNNPTGIYSAAQSLMYVMVEGEIKDGASLYLASYTGHGKLGGYTEGVELKSGLNVVPAYSSNSNYCINYVVHTFDTSDGKTGKLACKRRLSDYPALKIHIEGGHINGYYNKVGDELYSPDKNADWDYLEARATQTDLTVLGEYITLQFPLNDADTEGNKGLAYYFNERVKIEDAINEWDKVMLWERLLMGVMDEATIKANALKSPYSSEDYVIDYTGKDGDAYACDYGDYYNVHGLSFGVGGNSYMYGSWDHCGYHYSTMSGVIESLPTNAGSHWGPGHEIGHQHQGPLNMRGLTEVTNNLFSNVVLWYYGESTSRYNGDEGALSNVLKTFNTQGSDFFTNNIWAQTHMYYKFFLYYHVLGKNPKFYPVLFEMLRQDPMTIEYEQSGAACLLHFYKKCCLASGEDLTEFFRAHGFFRVMKDRFVGDYSNANYNMTQEEIDAAIAEIKALKYPENIAVLFINDATGETIKSHKGDNLDFYGESTICADLGSYASFATVAAPEYTYSLSATSITMEGTGGIGFAIYNENNEILAFSDKKSFSVSADALLQLTTGQARVVAIHANNTQINCKNILEDANTEQLRTELASLIDNTKAVLNIKDATETKVGHYRPAYMTSLEYAYDAAKSVYDNSDEVSYLSAYYSLLQEYSAFLVNTDAKIALDTDHTYILVNKAYPDRLMYIDGDNNVKAQAVANSYAYIWYFEPSDTEGKYYVKNAATSTYVGKISRGSQLYASATETKDAEKYELRDMGNGYMALIAGQGMHCSSSQGHIIVGWDAESDATQWTIVDVQAYDELYKLAAKTETLIETMAEEITVAGETEVALTADNYYSNATYTVQNNNDKFTSYSVLCDNNTSTYFHSDYNESTAPNENHYIRMDMGEGNALQCFKLDYTTRESGNVCAPTSIAIDGSNSDASDASAMVWNTIATISLGLPTENNRAYTSAPLTSVVPNRYIRMRVLGANGGKVKGYPYFVLSELGLYNVDYTAQLKDEYNSIDKSLVTEAYKAKLGAETLSLTENAQEALTHLQAKYDALLNAKNNMHRVQLDALIQEHVRTGLGYPKETSAEYIALLKATTVEEFNAALPAYKASSDIEMPQDGKSYTITAWWRSEQWPMSFSNTIYKPVKAATPVTFVCKQIEDKYVFISGNGYYLGWEADGKTGYTSSIYADGQQFLLEKATTAKNGGSVEGDLKDDELFGLFCMKAHNGHYLMFSSGDSEYHSAYAGNKFYGHTKANTVFFKLEQVQDYSVDVTISSAGYASFYTPIALTLPENLRAYAVETVEDNMAKMEAKDDIAASQGTILKGESGTYTLTIGKAISDWSANMLRGTATDTYIEGSAYVLSMQNGVLGFYKAMLNKDANGNAGTTHFLNNAGKAYLPVTDTNEARFLVFNFGEDTETAIDELKGEKGNLKAEVYDLAGRRVQNAQKGVFIVNGKVVIK